MRSYIVTFILTVVAFCSNISVYAQSKGPEGGPPPPNTNRGPVPVELAPIDDYLFLLVLVGVVYGAFKVYKLNSKKTIA